MAWGFPTTTFWMLILTVFVGLLPLLIYIYDIVAYSKVAPAKRAKEVRSKEEE